MSDAIVNSPNARVITVEQRVVIINLLQMHGMQRSLQLDTYMHTLEIVIKHTIDLALFSNLSLPVEKDSFHLGFF